MTFVGVLVDAVMIYSSFEFEVLESKNLADVTFINLTTLWMTLKTSMNRKEM